jgi:Fe-S-cluster-containing dehydrogenase component
MTQHAIIPINDSRETVANPSRRSVVQWLAASMALAASGCSRPPTERIYSYDRMPEIAANGAPLFYASACLRDGVAQGVLIGTQQGRPVKVEGNLDHPSSLGRTSVFSQAAIMQLWDPDRSTAVWQKTADGRRTPSTWPAFEAAWRAQAPRGARQVAVLSSRFTSPSLAAQLAAFLQRHPGARWYRDDTAEVLAARRGSTLAFGREVGLVHRFDRADLIVSLAADPFSDGAAGVRQSADWSTARAAALAAGRAPARLIALETTPGLFGARADERWALAPPAIESILWRAAAAFIDALPAPQGPSDAATQPIVDRLVALLRRHRGKTILCAGAPLSAESQALVHALNQRIGAFDAGISAIAAPELHEGVLPAPASLAELAQAIDAGAIGALLVLGANPAYSAPAALRFEALLQRVPFSVHHGLHRDETAHACTWHLPSGHEFEQWGDALAFDGTATLMQPAIAPLYATRSAIELLASLTTPSVDEGAVSGHTLLRARWQAQATVPDFESFWTDSLRRGTVAGSASAPIALTALRVPTAPPAVEETKDAVWAVFPADHSVGDGEHANNGWLQELPRPFTKITWGNALHLGPQTARARGLASGDIVRLRSAHGDGASIDVPVWVQSGHAEGAVTLPSGYGRRAAGQVGNDVGVDNAALRSISTATVRLLLERVGTGHAFSLTQIELDQHDRKLARFVDLGAAHQTAPTVAETHPSLYPPMPLDGTAWGMAIDLDACIGCNACTIACQAENNIPVVGPEEVRLGRTMHWIRVDTYMDEADTFVTQPVPCMHCENAPCEVVCPVGATMHDSEGLNVQVYNRCVGTRFCSNNCPYKVRRFNFRQYSDVVNETAKLMHNPDVTVRSRGVMEKCSYCVQRLSRARKLGQKTGEPLPRDTVETACQSACPTRAIHFGDLHDPKSDVSLAKQSPRHYAMLGDLNTRPRTTYLARVAALKDEA